MLQANITPTKTFVLDVGRHCSINCLFCYYKHLGDLRKQRFKPKSALFNEIEEGIDRGNNRTELTGGEPTLHPDIEEIIYYLKKNYIDSCIITNGLMSESKLYSIISEGVDEFLLSIHGTENTHNYLTQTNNARKVQEKTLKIISEAGLKNGFRFNCVLNAFNQNEILEITDYMIQWKPTTINFINMNPHHGWEKDTEGTCQTIADLRLVEPLLNQSIEKAEANNIKVNVRYYPMCRIAEKYRKCICNDLQVVFDKDEWDYNILPKTFDKFRQWGINTSNNVEEKGEPCNQCDLQWICGGANKHFHKASTQRFGEIIVPQKIENIDKSDFYFYRKDN